VPKLILLSATPSSLPISPEPVVYTLPIPTPFPVEIIYDPPEDDSAGVYDHAFDIIMDKHNDPAINGDFLVFGPGSKEADHLVD